MRVSIIGCPFKTTYGHYIQSLRGGLERSGADVQWIGSNCGCGDPVEVARDFQTDNLDYFEVPNTVGSWNLVAFSKDGLKRALKDPVRSACMSYRSGKYGRIASENSADVLHLQQTLNAFGSNIAFRLLKQNSNIPRVVTLHELDPEQTALPSLNETYNRAGAIIVHDSLMKTKIVASGVAADLVHVVCCGTDLGDFDEAPRDGIVFYGGHFLNKGKGFETLANALRRVKDKMADPLPQLRIHGHFGPPTQDALDLVARLGLDAHVEWLGELPHDEMVSLYRRSAVCVLPYIGSFAGLPASVAAANRLPIIATRFAGIPDHIADHGLWIGGNDPDELADRLGEVLGDPELRAACGRRLRAHAEQYLSWDAIARKTLTVYQSAGAGASADRQAEPALSAG